ncbi:MAG: hypothetical protein Kow0059_08440 [Candidatus Sumerlaeia bacterium]
MWLVIALTLLAGRLRADSPTPIRVDLQFPTGHRLETLSTVTGTPAESPVVAAPPGGTLSGLITLESAEADAGIVDVEVSLDEIGGGQWRLSPVGDAPVQPHAGARLSWRIELRATGEIRLVQFALSTPDVPDRATLKITARANGVECLNRRVDVAVSNPGEMAGEVEVLNVSFPAGRDGQPWSGRLSDAVVFPSVLWSALAQTLGGAGPGYNPYAPYAWLAVRVRNAGTRPIGLIIAAGPVVPPETNAGRNNGGMERENKSTALRSAATLACNAEQSSISAFFAADWWVAEPRALIQQTLLSLGAGEERVVTLPMFVAPETPAGRYVCPISVIPSGGSSPLAQMEYRFTVRRERGGAAVFVLVLAVVVSIGAVFFPGLLKTMMARLFVRQLALVSLFGALTVAGALLINVMNSPLQGLLGPFNAFIGGFAYRLMMAALWLSLLTLLPFTGVVALTSLIAYVIGGVFFGSFNPLDFLLVGSGILYKEALLRFTGAVRGLSPTSLPAPAPGPTAGFVWRVAVALGLAEACSTFTSLALQMVFYRLYFADWYIWAVVVVQSFGYIMLGVWLSRGLAQLVHRLSAPGL